MCIYRTTSRDAQLKAWDILLYEHLWQETCAINAQAANRTKLQLK